MSYDNGPRRGMSSKTPDTGVLHRWQCDAGDDVIPVQWEIGTTQIHLTWS